jgi:hypothetical protein
MMAGGAASPISMHHRQSSKQTTWTKGSRLPAMPELRTKILNRWSEARPRVLSSTIAASLAWVLTQHLLGHPQPIFAAIAAIGSLAPGVASRGRQAIGVLVGVAIGIVVAELMLLVLDTAPWLRILITTLVAMMAAASLGLSLHGSGHSDPRDMASVVRRTTKRAATVSSTPRCAASAAASSRIRRRLRRIISDMFWSKLVSW